MDTEIQRKIEKKGIVISRIPDWAKEMFIARAKQEFCDDYGMCLASMMKECEEYSRIKLMFFEDKFNVSFGSKNEEEIRFANGKKLNLNGGEK